MIRWVCSGTGRFDRRASYIALAAAALLYMAAYYYSDVRPRADAQYPLGWWGWFDQSEYIKSVRAFANLSFASSEHLYPPLYALIAAPFFIAFPDHPFLIPNFIYFTFYVYVLLRVSQRYYGPYLPAVVLVSMLGVLPVISLTQWIIPWTTSLQAALVSWLVLIFSRFESRNIPFQVNSRTDWFWFTAFFVFYGALTPTRPLDIVPWFPFALSFFINVLITNVKAAPPHLRLKTALLCLTAPALGGLVFVILYLLFNLVVFGSFFGVYLGIASRNLYLPADILEKAYSIFVRSGPIYGEYGQAFFEQIPVAAPVLAICIVTMWFVSGLRRWIVLTALLHFMIYLPYGDLLPTGTFRYYNLHYFKWAYPWLAVIAAGQALCWGAGVVRRAGGLKPLAASASILALLLIVDIVPADAEQVRDFRSQETRRVLIRAHQERQADFIDLLGLKGGFAALYLGTHKLSVDGTPARTGDFRLLPINGGARLLFLRPRTFRELELIVEKEIDLGPPEGVSVINSYSYAFGCRLRECLQPPIVAWAGNTIRLDFRSGGLAQGLHLPEWWEPEPWGRWSKKAATVVDLRVQPRPAIAVSATVIPLLASARQKQPVSLQVNGCGVASTEFTLADSAPRIIKGSIPRDCLRADGNLSIEIRTNTVRSPAALKINRDIRKLGFGISEIVLTSADRDP